MMVATKTVDGWPWSSIIKENNPITVSNQAAAEDEEDVHA
jgi:hypothetical protein